MLQLRLFILALGVLLWPPLVWTAYVLTRPEHTPPLLDYAVAAFAVVPAVMVLWRLSPVPWGVKALVTVLYVVLMFAAAIAISLQVVCARFGGCL